jgi:hypothetical protein
MYWQTRVQVICAISLILFECTYKIPPLAGDVLLPFEWRLDGEAECQGNRNLEERKPPKSLLRISRLTYCRMHRVHANKIFHCQIK